MQNGYRHRLQAFLSNSLKQTVNLSQNTKYGWVCGAVLTPHVWLPPHTTGVSGTRYAITVAVVLSPPPTDEDTPKRREGASRVLALDKRTPVFVKGSCERRP